MKTYLTAKEAAQRLGVQARTLYSYVSRGAIRSVAGADQRSRRYVAEDVDRWKARHDARAGHAAAAETALRWGAPVLDSAITRIAAVAEDVADGQVAGPIYRGHAATTLAESGRSFEDVAGLLWSGTLASAPVRWADAPLLVDAKELARLLRGVTDPIDALTLTTAHAHASDADRALASLAAPSVDHARARRLIRTLVVAIAIVSGTADVARVESSETIALGLARALGARAPKAATPWLDRALILSADHELNVSTFAARIASS
ncbi:MAG: citrate/2-methylcitrate synthase, partial [Polyangiales bacterium]